MSRILHGPQSGPTNMANQWPVGLLSERAAMRLAPANELRGAA